MRPHSARGGPVALALSVLGVACGSHTPATRFSVTRARTDVEQVAGTIGIRPVGTEANERARAYLVGQLERSGFRVHVQNADASRPEFGQTVAVSNVVGVLAGASPDAIALVAHYDSTPDGPGAADDGLGVAVCLEAGRVLAARPDRRHTLVVALTDAEENGLMGAAALINDPAWRQVRAFLNFEAVGTSGPSALFETGPGNTWLVDVWAAEARGWFGGSYAGEIYKRLNNDTDFTILKRGGAPGLNFAPIGNSYAYHTPLDTPDRLSDDTIRSTGDNAVAIVAALDRRDLGRSSPGWTLYFDVGGMAAVAADAWAAGLIAGVALVLGGAAWIRLLISVRRMTGTGRLVATALWTLAGLLAAAGLMIAAAWALRAAREVYHPWYAHPDRFFALLIAAGVFGWWAMGRLSSLVPVRVRAFRHPASAWCGILAIWLAIAAAMTWWAPAASYLVTLPLAAAGLSLIAVRPERSSTVRIASLFPLFVSGVLWMRLAPALAHFMVPMFGRLPVITPIFVYPAILLVAALFIVAPALPLISAWQPRWAQPSLVTVAALLAFALSLSLAYVSPAYTAERPIRRSAQYIQDTTLHAAFWEVGGNEPGIDLEPVNSAPSAWMPVTDAAPVSVPVDRPGGPFRLRAPADAGLATPADVSATIEPVSGGIRLEIAVRPRDPGATIVWYLPAGVTVGGASFSGAVRGRRWRAIYVAPPPEGVTLRVTVRAEDQPALSDCRVVVITRGLPGGAGPLQLPPWLPQAAVAWRARTVSILRVPFLIREEATRHDATVHD